MFKPGDIVKLKITDLSHDGAGVGRAEELVVFVPESLPGEKVEVEITEIRKNFSRGKLRTILQSSTQRMEPPCPIYGKCGGCQLQHLNYQAQLDCKKERVKKALSRISSLKDISVNPVLGMKRPWHYRNKAQLHTRQIKGQLKLGYYQYGTRSLIPIENCLLLPKNFSSMVEILKRELNKAVVKAYDPKTKKGSLKHLVIKQSEATGEIMLIFVTVSSHFPQGKILSEKLRTLEPKIKSVVHNINPNPRVILGRDFLLLDGQDRIKEKLGVLKFLISPSAFFQVNTKQASLLSKKVAQYANLSGDEIVFDLYCGIGTFSLELAQWAKKVYGIEVNTGAIQDAKVNADLNGINNTEFIPEKVEKALPNLLAKNIKPDLILVDPPRQGVDSTILKEIAKAGPPKLIYVSCNPETLARDLGILKDLNYQPQEIQPIDMFGQTSHVECVALMSRE